MGSGWLWRICAAVAGRPSIASSGPDDQAGQAVREKLAAAPYDCLVIGAGIRSWPRHLPVFEAILNAAREAAPATAIAFNTRPQDSAAAVERVCREAPRS